MSYKNINVIKFHFLLLVLLSLFTTTEIKSIEYLNVRRCLLIPIGDNVSGAISYPVFNQVESYLKESSWCFYKSNSDIIDILGNYKATLHKHLENKEVLKILAEKSKAGSIIKINLERLISGVKVYMKVIGENGEDIYFKQSIDLPSDDVVLITETIKNWLDQYEKKIPYDGRILGVLGNQFTMDFGKLYGVVEGSDILIVRPIGKKRHPLLKEIVDWQTERIAKGKVAFVSKNQSQGKIIKFESKKSVGIGDWIILDKRDSRPGARITQYENEDDFEFGKLGQVELLFNIGKSSATIASSSFKKMAGTTLGIDINSTVWATRNYWLGLDLKKNFTTLKKEEGSFSNNSNNLASSYYRFKLGYKYLPMGFFYGPQVDTYVGYTSVGYGLDTQLSDGLLEVKFKGLSLGAKGTVPFSKLYNLHLELGLIFNPTYEEEQFLHGEDDSSSSYMFRFGGNYNYNPTMKFDLSYQITGSKAKFTNTQTTLKMKESLFKIGTIFIF